jgi:hypothetical protein
MKNEFGAVVPHNRVIQILDLIKEKKETDPKCRRMVRKQPRLMPRRGHDSIPNTPNQISTLPSEYGNNRTRQRVHPHMTRQNMPMRGRGQNFVRVAIQVQLPPHEQLNSY